MTTNLRVVDSGIRPAREQIAFDQALVDLHQRGELPDTLRFLQFKPAVLVGRHQALAREVRVDYCNERQIEIGRRLTGGGAIYMDEGQLGWELVVKRQSLQSATLPEVTRSICEAAAAGLSTLGVQASYRPFSDIEVQGRKLSGTGGYFDGDTLIYQGTVLIAMDPSAMVNALKIPQSRESDKGNANAERQVVTLSELLGHAPPVKLVKQALVDAFAGQLGFEPSWSDISAAEQALTRQVHDDEIGLDDFVYGIDDPASDPNVLTASNPTPGGTIHAHIRLEGAGAGRIRQVLLSGDFFVAPSRTVLDLEAALRGVASAAAPDAVDQFFSTCQPELMTVKPQDIRDTIARALAQARP